jgi:hypothetical protein
MTTILEHVKRWFVAPPPYTGPRRGFEFVVGAEHLAAAKRSVRWNPVALALADALHLERGTVVVIGHEAHVYGSRTFRLLLVTAQAIAFLERFYQGEAVAPAVFEAIDADPSWYKPAA